jgi:hypothetical protein
MVAQLSLPILRWILLVWSLLGLFTATILDGVMMRFIVAPWLRANERMAGGGGSVGREAGSAESVDAQHASPTRIAARGR